MAADKIRRGTIKIPLAFSNNTDTLTLTADRAVYVGTPDETGMVSVRWQLHPLWSAQCHISQISPKGPRW